MPTLPSHRGNAVGAHQHLEFGAGDLTVMCTRVFDENDTRSVTRHTDVERCNAAVLR
jgi:hypothetical protein